MSADRSRIVRSHLRAFGVAVLAACGCMQSGSGVVEPVGIYEVQESSAMQRLEVLPNHRFELSITFPEGDGQRRFCLTGSWRRLPEHDPDVAVSCVVESFNGLGPPITLTSWGFPPDQDPPMNFTVLFT